MKKLVRGCSKFYVTEELLTRFACWPLIFNRAIAQSDQRLESKQIPLLIQIAFEAFLKMNHYLRERQVQILYGMCPLL